MKEPVRFVPGYNNLMAAIRGLTYKPHKAQVNSAYDKALGYAWGRQDSPGWVHPDHTMDSMDFATSYATHVLDGIVNGAITRDIRTAYEAWSATGVIA